MANNENSSGPRQAVLLIHGIGEQRPMETLRSFVGAFLEPGSYHSKPDLLSATFEMRRLKLRKLESSDPKIPNLNPDWPETDFYEYYWAHQMYGTTIAHIFSWLWRVLTQGVGVLKTGGPRVHKRLRWLVPAVWMLVLAGIAAALIFAVKQLTEPSRLTVGVGVAVLVVVWGWLRGPLLGKLTDIAGDAARYLDINPKNITRRYDIIRGGVDILRKLHTEHDERGDEKEGAEVMYRYGRVVLVGHSLGSVIAYDILKHYWQEVNGKMKVDPAQFAAIESFEGGNGKAPAEGLPPHENAMKFRGDQYAAWLYLNRDKPAGVTMPFVKDRDAPHDARWLISDFVTLGCPLTYAPLLMAKSVEDLTSMIALRELPVCPPDRSKHLNPGRFTVRLSAEIERIVDFDVLPQSAQFATVRWTNFFFHNDPIGGPLACIFGKGVDDHELRGPTLRPITAHIGYWNKYKLEDAPRCVAHLEKILKNRS
jgi:hypothetical protein